MSNSQFVITTHLQKNGNNGGGVGKTTTINTEYTVIGSGNKNP